MISRRFMLDTDTVSFALRGQGQVNARIRENQPSLLCVSAISVAELRFGADHKKSNAIHAKIDAFLGDLEIVPFDEVCARHFGTIASALAGEGTPIGDFDVMIAATALAVQATLVTNNVKHFARVRGLRVENWF